ALSELAGRDFDEQAGPAPAAGSSLAPAATGGGHTPPRLSGAPRVASGPARPLAAPEAEVPRPPAGGPRSRRGARGKGGEEWEALTRAREQVRAEIRATRDSVAGQAGDYSAAIFDAHLLFLDDEALLGPARRAIFEEGKNAARAWHDAAETVAADYRALDDEYMQARAEDLTGVARQGVAALTGGGGAALGGSRRRGGQ